LETPVVNALPAVDFDAPLVNPAGNGLYAAASVNDVTGPFRHQGGVIVRPINCSDAYGTWSVDPCLDPGTARKKGDRGTPVEGLDPIGVWGYDECDPQETDAQVSTRATQNLRIHEPLVVESAFAAGLLPGAAALGTVTSFVDAVGELEAFIGESGIPGIIHASRRFAAHAAAANLIVSSGPLLRTPLGNTWAFGGGYETPLANNLLVTGPAFVWRSEVSTMTTLDARTNRRVAVAERVVTLGLECPDLTGKVVFDPTP
jgi:hypothetical protein